MLTWMGDLSKVVFWLQRGLDFSGPGGSSWEQTSTRNRSKNRMPLGIDLLLCGLVQSCAILCDLVRSCAILCSFVRACAILCHLVRSCAILRRLVPSCAVLCDLVLTCAILCCLVRSCAALCDLVRPHHFSDQGWWTWLAGSHFMHFCLVRFLVRRGHLVSVDQLRLSTALTTHITGLFDKFHAVFDTYYGLIRRTPLQISTHITALLDEIYAVFVPRNGLIRRTPMQISTRITGPIRTRMTTGSPHKGDKGQPAQG